MNEFFIPLLGGLSQLTDPLLWFYVLIGTVVGVVVGALPGLGATVAYGLVLPFTFVMSPVHAVAFLLAISVGNQFGNSIPAILMGIPGSPAAILTVIDGHTLHKRGDSGYALGIAYTAALGGQFVSILLFILLVVPLMGLAYSFLYPEIFALYFLGMIAIVSLTGNNVVKGLIAAVFGIAIGLVGLDPINNVPRFDFDYRPIRSGFETVPVVIGLLAVSELFRSARQVFQWKDLSGEAGVTRFPSWSRLKRTIPAMFGGTLIGTLIGAVPGAGTTPATMISYQAAQLASKHPEEFGHGSPEGIAANEAAQNASNSGELIPTLGLGIPGGGSMVLLLSALTVHGFIPGPLMVSKAPHLLYAAIGGMLASTFLLLVVGWRMGTMMLAAVRLDRSIIIIVSLALIVLGMYSLSGRVLDVIVCLAFGGVGYFMLRYGYSTPAAALAVYLGKEFERNLRIGLNYNDDSFVSFFARPITGTIMAIALALLIYGSYRQVRMRRQMREAAATAAK